MQLLTGCILAEQIQIRRSCATKSCYNRKTWGPLAAETYMTQTHKQRACCLHSAQAHMPDEKLPGSLADLSIQPRTYKMPPLVRMHDQFRWYEFRGIRIINSCRSRGPLLLTMTISSTDTNWKTIRQRRIGLVRRRWLPGLLGDAPIKHSKYRKSKLTSFGAITHGATAGTIHCW